MSEDRQYHKPLDCPEWRKLHEIGLAIERKNGSLPSVRRDSPQWEMWRKYIHSIGLPTTWTDKQPPEFMLTVTFEWPPNDHADLERIHAQWVRGGKGTSLGGLKGSNLLEGPKE